MFEHAQRKWYSVNGEGRTSVCLSVYVIGEGTLVFLHNENMHIGAVAVSEFDSRTDRVSTSVITLLGHKDDTVAKEAAYSVAKHTRKPVCAIAGIHVDNITDREISDILDNARRLVEEFILQI